MGSGSLWQGRDFANSAIRKDVGQLGGYDNRNNTTLKAGALAGFRQAPSARESQLRQDQVRNLDMMGQLARGQGPSAADAQLRDSLRRNVSAQQALAASARPGQGAAAQRMASQQGSLLGGSLAGQGAVARANEQVGAINALSGALQGARGQDLQRNFANQGAQLQQTGLNDQQQQAMYGLNLQNAAAQQQGLLNAQNQRTNLMLGAMDVPTSDEEIMGAFQGGVGTVFSMFGGR